MHPLGNFDGSEDIEVRLRSFVVVKPNLTLSIFFSDIHAPTRIPPVSTSAGPSTPINIFIYCLLQPITRRRHSTIS